MKKNDPAKHLPARAPKKTGSRGIGPLDPSDDFDTPVKKDLLEELDKPNKRKSTSLLVEQPPKPKVVGDRMAVFYLKPVISKTPKGDILLAMKFTVPLEKDHQQLLPKIVADGYHDVSKKGRKGIGFKDLPGQRVEIFLSHDDKDTVLFLPAAKLISVSLALVERKGEGSARKVIRLSFSLQVKLNTEVAFFAENNLQNTFWLRMEECQQDLFDEEEEE